MYNKELSSSIELKKQILTHDRQIDQMKDDYKSMNSIGSNYYRQLEKQKRVEELQKNIQDNYTIQVGSPTMDKLKQRLLKEERDQTQARQRYDLEQNFIDLQKV